MLLFIIFMFVCCCCLNPLRLQVLGLKQNFFTLNIYSIAYHILLLTGDPGQIRTGDLQLRRLLLYPAELLNHIKLERVMRIELTTSVWKTEILPLNYARILWCRWWNSNPHGLKTEGF